jgi:hypothetical protein
MQNPGSDAGVFCLATRAARHSGARLRVLLFDQTYLPITPSLLEFFFTRDGGNDVVVDLKPDQLVDPYRADVRNRDGRCR